MLSHVFGYQLRFVAATVLAIIPAIAAAQLPPPTEAPPRLAMNFRGPVGRTTGMVFSPDSARLAVCSLGKSVEIWDVGWNRPTLGPGQDLVTHIRSLRWEIARGTRGAINAIDISSDGIVAVGGFSARGQTGDVVLFDEPTGNVIQALPPTRTQTGAGGHEHPVLALAFAPDGRRLLSADSIGSIWLWSRVGNAWAGEPVFTGEKEIPAATTPIRFLTNDLAAVSIIERDGTYSVSLLDLSRGSAILQPVASGMAESITAIAARPATTQWAFSTGQLGDGVRSFDGKRELGGTAGQANEVVRTLVWTPTGRLIVGSNRFQGQATRGTTIRYYDPAGALLDEAKATKEFPCVVATITPDGRRYITHDDGSLSLLEFELLDATGVELAQPFSGGVTRSFRGVGQVVRQVSMPSPQALTLQLDKFGQEQRTFDLDKLDLSLPFPADPSFEPEPFSILRAGNRFDPASQATYETLQVVPRGGRPVSLELDVAKQRTFSGAAALIQDPASGRQAIAVGTKPEGGIFVYEISPVAGGGSRLLRHYRDHAGEVLSLTVSPDNRMLVSSSLDQSVKLWSLDGLFAPNDRFGGASSWGMTLAANENRITALEPSGIAANRGLRVGDVIARVRTLRDQQLVAATDAAGIRNLLADRQTLSESYLVDVMRNGQPVPAERVIVPAWEPLASLVVDQTGDWALFTPSPESYYAASIVNGTELFGWQVNRGPNYTPRFVSADDLQSEYERPDVLRQVIAQRSVQTAVNAIPLQQKPPALAEAIRDIPKIVIESPVANTQVPFDQPVDIVTVIEGPGVRDFDISATHGGRAVPDVVSDTTTGNTRRVTFRTRAFDGLNSVVVRASSGQNVLSSRHTSSTVTFRSSNVPDGVELRPYDIHLLGIGVSNYSGDWGKLPYSISDVESVCDAFEACITDGPVRNVNVTTVLEDDVTAQSVEKAIDEIINRVGTKQSNDVVIAFIRGHGDSVNEDREYRFIPPSVTSSEQPVLQKFGIPWTVFSKLQTARCHVIWLLDTCRSGTAIYEARNASMLEARKSVSRSAKVGRRTVITSASANQEAIEGERFDGGHGAFTLSILKGLEGYADGYVQDASGTVIEDPKERDNAIRIYEFGSYVQDHTYAITNQQQEPKIAPIQSRDQPPVLVFRKVPRDE